MPEYERYEHDAPESRGRERRREHPYDDRSHEWREIRDTRYSGVPSMAGWDAPAGGRRGMPGRGEAEHGVRGPSGYEELGPAREGSGGGYTIEGESTMNYGEDFGRRERERQRNYEESRGERERREWRERGGREWRGERGEQRPAGTGPGRDWGDYGGPGGGWSDPDRGRSERDRGERLGREEGGGWREFVRDVRQAFTGDRGEDERRGAEQRDWGHEGRGERSFRGDEGYSYEGQRGTWTGGRGTGDWGDPNWAGRERESWSSRSTGGGHYGRGPKGYSRSDQRIQDDVCERLTEDDRIDARNIELDVQKGEVTLRGAVETRAMKFWAEEVAENVLGVRDVHNQIRVTRPGETPVSAGTAAVGGSTGASGTGTGVAGITTPGGGMGTRPGGPERTAT